ncbi:DUF1232 domain-containing protein [Desulfosarcina sp. OttesenSCG-928-A07]|nr:DUF1232 domain-containing protein [Desulfosarcina sp. OttesenSCG-928-G17]MDL2328598.1 DUF1232 domain-containing protein [Desulfosarcina sp. OttesenSCG-928-A07]
MRFPTPKRFDLIKRLILDCRLLAGLIKDYITGRYRNVSALSGVICVLMLAYIVIPMDLVSDFIPGFGQLDDVAVFLVGLGFLEKDLYRYQAWKKEKSDPQTTDDPMNPD